MKPLDIGIFNNDDSNHLGLKKFLDLYYETLPYIDPDSPRFVDWLSTIRMYHGQDTKTRSYEFANDQKNVSLNELVGSLDTFSHNRASVSPDRRVRKFVYETIDTYRVLYVDKKSGCPYLLMVLTSSSVNCTIIAIGDYDWVDKVYADITSIYEIPNAIDVTNLMGFDDNGKAIVREHTLKEDDSEIYLAKDAFYPYIEEGVDALVDGFLNSRSSLMVFIGPPGTGKSTLLRSVMFKAGKGNNYLINNEDAVKHSQLIPWINLQAEDDSLLLLEDADKLCEKREDGNEQMSGLLNYTDGVINNNTKIIVSTNLATLKHVDQALIRPGRAYKVIHFRKLTPDEANRARQAVGLEPFDFRYEELTLGEALNVTSSEQFQSKSRLPGVGFL